MQCLNSLPRLLYNLLVILVVIIAILTNWVIMVVGSLFVLIAAGLMGLFSRILPKLPTTKPRHIKELSTSMKGVLDGFVMSQESMLMLGMSYIVPLNSTSKTEGISQESLAKLSTKYSDL